jgi:hypothetical protein
MESMRQKSASIHNIADWADNRRDDFTGLREHLNRARQRGDKYEGLTLDHLLAVWDRQRGKCAFTGVALEHPRKGKKVSFNFLASLDRIDSSKGYRDGNVQFVSVTVNHLKNSMSDSDVIEFLSIVQGALGDDRVCI